MARKEEDFLRLAAERFTFASTEDREERVIADDDVRFAWNDGNAQWPAQVKQQRESQVPPRPCLVINKITEKIDLIDGEFRQLAPSAKIRAIDSLGDPAVADVITGMVRHIESVSKARVAYNTAYASVLYSGRGAWRIDVQDSDDNPFVRELTINRINNIFSLYIDPAASAIDKSDMDWCFVTDFLTMEEFRRLYGDELVMDWPTDNMWEGWLTEKGVRIAEYWFKEWKKVDYFLVRRMVEGVETTVAVTEPDPFDEVLEQKKVEVPQIKWCKLTANKIIEDIQDFPGKYIPIVWLSGKEATVGGSVKTRGMPRYAKTPQQMYNYWSSNNTELIALAPKSPYLLTPGMIGKNKKQWDEAHYKNFFYLLYETDPANPQLTPRREPPPQVSTAIAAEMARCEHDINASMGLHEPSLGQSSQERSGRAILARQSRGSLGAYTYIDNFGVSLEHSTRILINLVPHVYDTQRIIRIIGDDEQTYSVPVNASPGMPMMGVSTDVPTQYMAPPRTGVTQLVNDLTVGKYDVAVTIGPSYATLKEETMSMLTELMKVTPPQMLMGIFDLIVENFDMPKIDQLKKRVKEIMSTPPPPDPKVALETEKLALEFRKLLREEFDSHFKAMGIVAQAESLEVGTQVDQYFGVVDRQHKQIELQQQQEQLAQQQQAAQQQGA